jgi:hypothetical protein
MKWSARRADTNGTSSRGRISKNGVWFPSGKRAPSGHPYGSRLGLLWMERFGTGQSLRLAPRAIVDGTFWDGAIPTARASGYCGWNVLGRGNPYGSRLGLLCFR